MRRGRTFKRCTHCGGRVPEKRCTRCGADSFTWAYVVDTAPLGAPRQQTTRAGFKTKADALEAIALLQTSKAAGTYVEPSRLTTGDYLRQWVSGVKADVRGSTWRSYEGAVRLHVRPALGTVPLQALTTSQIKTVYASLTATGRSAKTVHNTHLCLRKALADAVDAGLLTRNPADRAHKLPKDIPEMQTWSAEELRRFLERSAADPNLPLWRLAANTGMRRGELLGLRWRDVSVDGGRVAVRQQLVRTSYAVGFGPPKTKAGRRSVSLDQGTLSLLRALRASQAAGKLRWGSAYRDHDLVFCRADGSPHDPDVISQQFALAIRRTGLKRIRLHDLRHSHATLLLEAGIHPKVVQERLGHSSVMVTLDRYSHVTPNMQNEAAARIGAVIDGA